MTKEPSNSGNKRTRLREWRVVLMRSRGEFLGHVEASSLEAAELLATQRYGLSEFHRKRLLLQERL
jgi:hypothetical protein